MRKLVVGSIVFVILFVTWKLYLDYDTKRFVRGLPTPPAPKQHQDSTPKTDPVTPKEREDKTATEALESAYEPALSETSEDFKQLVETEADTVFDTEALEIDPEVDNSGLSPELETLFSAYHTLYQQGFEIAMELNPLISRDISYNRQALELFSALNGEDDELTQKALGDELDAIKAWRKEFHPTIKALCEARTQVSEQRLTLLAQYGMTSYDDFMRYYDETYENWKTQNGF